MGKIWVQNELYTLQNNYSMRMETLMKLLPGRTKISIYSKLRDLGLFKHGGRESKYPKPKMDITGKTIITCYKCGQTKPLSEFCKNKNESLGINRMCKSCKAKYDDNARATPSRIYTSIKNRCKTYKKHRMLMTRKEFVFWYENEPKKCHYCGLSFDELNLIDDILNNGVRRLSVDRKNNDIGYIKENLVLACKRCNSIKLDFFTYEEMVELAKIYIIPKWEKKLKEIKV